MAKNENTQLAEIVSKNGVMAQDVEVLSVDEIELMTMAELQEEKQKLAQRRTAVLLKLDRARLHQAEKIIDRMDYFLDRMIGSYDENGELNEVTPFDLKQLASAYKDMVTAYNTVTRLDSCDSGGTASRLSLRFEMPDGSLRGQIDYKGR